MRTPWTKDQLKKLCELYPDNRAEDLVETLGHAKSSIYSKARKLNLSKSDVFKASEKSGRLRGEQGVTSRFKKGEAPWNKGSHYQAGGRSKQTQFKQGRKPHNYKPVGSERWFGGYLQRKIYDTGRSANDWVEVHRIIWTEACGEIPKGFVVVFINGNKEDIRLENLELISRGDLAKRNSIHNYPEELRQVMRMQGQVKRQIKKREKQQNEK